ncbi:MAG: hypothetical protein JNG90_13800, partial [Planctomycetaceae bacterium]|nr:hypothetical protein [Planctomycetaceae bacterium]
MKRTALWLGILVAGAAGCHRPAATPPRAASAAPTSPPVEQAKSTEPAQPALDASPPPAKEMTPAGRVLLFSPVGPLLLELVVTIDGQSLPELRRKAVSRLVERLTEQEGGELAWESALEDPRFALVPPPRGRPERKALLAAIDLNHDGQVQADEAVEFYARQDQLGPPLRFAATASAWSERGSSPLWQLADQNGDGQIEATELAALADLLAARDTDGDELITENELAGGQMPESQESMQDLSSGRGSSRLAVLCDATFRGEAVAYLLEELYPSGERSAAELSTVDRLIAAVDRNGNGRIDGRESLALPQAEPVGRIRVAFGPGVSPADQVVVEWFDPQLSAAAPSQRPPEGIACELAGNRLVIERDEQTAVALG